MRTDVFSFRRGRMARTTAVGRLALGMAAASAGLQGVESVGLPVADISSWVNELQITRAAHGHVLANTGVWSPDGAWIVYDCRDAGEKFDATRIEAVNVMTGEVRCLYESRSQACCGVAAWNPYEPRVVFILGPEHPTAGWAYGSTRRRGVLADLQTPGQVHPLDAMNYAPPFAPGALRGGSHLHVFSPDGQWVCFTYEDEILARFAPLGSGHDINQRNIGVAVPAGPVRVNANHPRNHDGDFFSVVVSRTVVQPRPGSDEISRACEEGWIGRDGYLRTDGTRQRRALAFQGTVTAPDGRSCAEVFALDLPDDLTVAGTSPLEGTATRWPAPPCGVVQHRLTFTTDRKFPGVAAIPRHWLRSSPDGAQIAFLLQDDDGRAQFWVVSPAGGPPRQLSRHPWGVASTFTWSPDGRWLAHVLDNSVCVTDAVTGRGYRLTPRTAGEAAPHRSACVFSPDGQQIAFLRRVQIEGRKYLQIHTVILPRPVPIP
jgi:WD40 repeat protein